MNITPHLGIGDLLILKMKQLSNNFIINTIYINTTPIKIYHVDTTSITSINRDYALKVYFMINFIHFLFPNVNVIIKDDEPINFITIINQYKLTDTYLYNYVNDNMMNFNNKYTDYIIFHTKIRHDNLIDKFLIEILPELNAFLKNFKTSKKILLLGEKNIGTNLETKIHKTFSLYNNLLLLKNNNVVIDMTHDDVLLCGNPDFNSFLSEIEIINKAICNVTFGIGGPYNMCKAFSQNNISFIPFYQYSPYANLIIEMNTINNSIVDNVKTLCDKLNNL